MRHDMAPMARRVADRKQGWFSCYLERFVIPGMPVHRVVLVLDQIGTCCLVEAIAVLEM